MEQHMAVKQCARCGEMKPVFHFGFKYGTSDGLQLSCRKCNRHNRNVPNQYVKRQQTNWREQGINGAYFVMLHRNYKLTEAGWKALTEKQGGVCAICGGNDFHKNGNKKRLVVDHCHKTGAVRGLLCHRCNAGLGMARDSIDILNKMASYLGSSALGGKRNATQG